MYCVDLLEPLDPGSNGEFMVIRADAEEQFLDDPMKERPEGHEIGSDVDVSIDEVLSMIEKQEGEELAGERSDLDDNPGQRASVGCHVGCCIGELPRIIRYRETVIPGVGGSLVIGCADVAIPGQGIRSVHGSAYLSHSDYDPSEAIDISGDELIIGGIFDDIAKPFVSVAKSVSKPIESAVKTVAHGLEAAGKVTGKALSETLNIPSHIPFVGPALQKAIDATPVGLVKRVASGQRIDKAVLANLKDTAKVAKAVAPYAATIVSLVPGVGTGVAGAIAAASALAEGRRIDDALIAGVRGAVPGGQLAQTAFDSAVSLAKGKNLKTVALEAARAQLPNEAAKKAFDIGLSVIAGKKLQDAAIDAAKAAGGEAIKQLGVAQSLAHATLAKNVLEAAKDMTTAVKAGSKLAGLAVKVPGVTTDAMAAFSSAKAALDKMQQAKNAVNAGIAVTNRLKAEAREPTPPEKAALVKAAAGKVVHLASAAELTKMKAAAAAGNKDAQKKVAVLRTVKAAVDKGAGRRGHLVTETGQILTGNFASV